MQCLAVKVGATDYQKRDMNRRKPRQAASKRNSLHGLVDFVGHCCHYLSRINLHRRGAAYRSAHCAGLVCRLWHGQLFYGIFDAIFSR